MNKLINRMKELLKYAADIGFFHLVSANLLLQIVGFGMQIVLARILSQEDIARISILQSFYATFIIVGQLGVSSAVVKLCSEDIDKGHREEIMTTGIKINVLTTLLVVAGVTIGSYYGVFSQVDPMINSLIRVYIWQLPFVVMVYLFQAYFQAQSKIRKMSTFMIVLRLLVIGSNITFSILWGIKGYVTGIVIANAIGFIILLSVSSLKVSTIARTKVRKPVLNKIFNYTKYSFVAMLIYQWTLSINVLMANYLITENQEQIAIYSMANFFVTGIIMIPSSYNQIMVPKLSKNTNRLDVAWKLFADMRKKMYLLIILLFVAAQFIVPIAIPLLLGEEYRASIEVFRVLSFGLLTWGIYSPIGNTMLAIGKVRYNVITNAVVITIQVVLNLILIPKFGIMGMAYSFVCGGIGASVLNLYLLHYVFKDYKHVDKLSE